MSTSESASELLQAQAQIWNHIFSFMRSSALRCAIQLDIPDVLYKHGKPMHISDLSSELSLIVDPSKISFLPNLMRFVVHSGILEQQVDVGGGIGTVAIAIAKGFPNMKCIVLDLPHVIEDLKSNENLEFVGGDMFEKIPNANAILLKWILHSWNDEDCLKILKKCKESIPSRDKGGKLIIIDIVLEDPKNTTDYVQAQHNMDLTMMVCFATKERTKREWEKLFNEAGFNECKITSIPGSRSLIEVYP